jgi:nitroimidazol reductase NimA-like FMN-containing flavoprotein (pyridoxamine 5'-phosphate oxidase superfamily)
VGEHVIDDRIMAMLRETTIVRVATVTPGGRPHVAPYWFACDGERFVISTLLNQTVRNLLADPRVAVLVDLGSDFRDLRGALIQGRARVYREAEKVPPQVQSALDAIDRIHAHELEEPEFRRYDGWETREHVVLDIEPISATWFDLGRSEMGRTAGDRRPIGPHAEAATSGSGGKELIDDQDTAG